MTNQPNNEGASNRLVSMPAFRYLLTGVFTAGVCTPVILLLELVPVNDVSPVALVILVIAVIGAQVHERMIAVANAD